MVNETSHINISATCVIGAAGNKSWDIWNPWVFPFTCTPPIPNLMAKPIAQNISAFEYTYSCPRSRFRALHLHKVSMLHILLSKELDPFFPELLATSQDNLATKALFKFSYFLIPIPPAHLGRHIESRLLKNNPCFFSSIPHQKFLLIQSSFLHMDFGNRRKDMW